MAEKKESKSGPEEGMSLAALNKEIDQYSTDANAIQQIDRDFQDVIRDFSGEPDLELFKIKYETMYNSLKESYENEIRWIKKYPHIPTITRCKEHNSEIVMYSSKVQMSLKMANDDEQQADVFKRDLEEKWRKIDELKDRENELKDKIIAAKVELQQLGKQLEKGIDDIDEQNQIILNDKRRVIEDLVKQLHGMYSKLSYLRTQNENLLQDLKQEEQLNLKQNDEIGSLKEQIIRIKSQAETEERRKDLMDNEMAITKQKIDEAKTQQAEKTQLIIENKLKAEQITKTIHLKIKEKEHFHDRLRYSQQNRFAMEKETENQQEAVKVIKDQIEQLNISIAKQIEEIDGLKKVIRQVTKDKENMGKLKNAEKSAKESLQIDKETLQAQLEQKQTQLGILRSQRDQLKDSIDHKLKERTQHSKLLKKAEDEDHNMDEEIVNLLNNLKKVENQVLGYEAENEKLRKMIAQLQREQEKYGIEASQAHAKYYQTIEEVKIKNNQIAELQKKNTEVEAKLKHQQNLYEAVRSDRNLYSKNLLESQEEIAELTKKYTRMTHQVDQLKEEIKTKDSHLIKQDFDFHKVVKENRQTKLEKDRVKKAIRSTEEVIKNQENHISRLKYIIQEAKTEKARQEKDYEMVVNERDILGTQLIKRNQELAVLYEKIKLSQSNLAKGEINFREKQLELKNLQKELTNLRNELKATQDQISCITDLKNEINSLDKDLLNEKNKVKALQDELTNPMNVHRWRKLEATDQENFERILKIQTLQRRLIAKTEEVQEKETLIKEKEKLFMELKNILSRQPGAEIHQQLASYKESLKEKTSQMKKMLGELKNSQDSVDILRFEISRLKGELGKMKSEYFKRRREEDREREGEENNGQPKIEDILHQQNQQLLANGPRLQQNNFMIGGTQSGLIAK